MSSHVVRVIALNKASRLDLITTSCFLLFKGIRLSSIKIEYLEVEHLFVVKLAQSASS